MLQWGIVCLCLCLMREPHCSVYYILDVELHKFLSKLRLTIPEMTLKCDSLRSSIKALTFIRMLMLRIILSSHSNHKFQRLAFKKKMTSMNDTSISESACVFKIIEN